MMGETVPAAAAKSPAAATPPTQPSVAQRVLRLRPVSSSREAAVVRATMTTVTKTGSAPRRIMGTRINQRQARV